MHCLRCGECCKETEMLLSNEDIKRLEKRGYDRNSFVRFDREGFAILRNVNGNCFFFDAEKTTCRERANRPLGCRIYPVILDEEKGTVVDEICPVAKTFTEKEKSKRGKRVIKLLEKIDAEAQERQAK
jgi:Fe-S-cluster containining protein